MTKYLYDGDALVGEYNASGTMTARYVHGDQVDEPWVQFAGTSTSLSNTRFLHSNHQGSVIAQSNTSAAVIATNAYDTYGVSGDVSRVWN